MEVLNLPGMEDMKNHLETVEGIQGLAADDCVRTLAGEGKSYKEARSRAVRLSEALTDKQIQLLEKARRVIQVQWPVLQERSPDEKSQWSAQELSDLLQSDLFYESIEAIRQTTASILAVYTELYHQKHNQRSESYSQAIESIKGLPDWLAISEDPSIPETERNAILSPLNQRALQDFDLPEGEAVCRSCRATLSQIETDILAVEAIKNQVLKALQRVADPGEKIERVKISTLLTGKLESPNDVDAALKQLREYLLKLLSSGVKIILE
jgi:hypothetical protein